jgi:hypothetical protein
MTKTNRSIGPAPALLTVLLLAFPAAGCGDDPVSAPLAGFGDATLSVGLYPEQIMVGLIPAAGACPALAGAVHATLDGQQADTLERGGGAGASCTIPAFSWHDAKQWPPADRAESVIELSDGTTTWRARVAGLTARRTYRLVGAAGANVRNGASVTLELQPTTDEVMRDESLWVDFVRQGGSEKNPMFRVLPHGDVITVDGAQLHITMPDWRFAASDGDAIKGTLWVYSDMSPAVRACEGAAHCQTVVKLAPRQVEAVLVR